MGARLQPPAAAARAGALPGDQRAVGPAEQPAGATGIRPLCVYGPIHYQELPELFMDYVCSLTGTSPSTTGAGSEGALTKGPFNALAATADLNNALVSMLLTGYAGFSSAAGFIGPRYRVDHDISLLIPEIWCRLFPHERDPKRLIEAGHLEKLEDYEFDGKQVLASRLGYRITAKFVHTYFGRVFDNPTAVFTEEILRPETAGSGGVRRRGRTTSSRRSSGWRRRTSRTARIEDCLPAAPGADPHHGPRTASRDETRATPRSARCSPGSRCWRATGTPSA